MLRPRLAPAEAVRAAAGEAPVVDVREPAEVQGSGKARGAINLPPGRLPAPASGERDKRLKAATAAGRSLRLCFASRAGSERGAAIPRRLGHARRIGPGNLPTRPAGGGAIVR